MANIIGITGQKQNGKDTTGKYLVENYGYEHLSFAQPLKDACKSIFGFNDDQLYGNLKEEIDGFWNCAPRDAMQYVGTELFRNQIHVIMPSIGDNIWVECLKRKIYSAPQKKYVITDVRFENECNMIHELGGKIIRVYGRVESRDNHISENTKLDADFELYNGGTLNELHTLIDAIMLSTI